jgi:hypothetical protein
MPWQAIRGGHTTVADLNPHTSRTHPHMASWRHRDIQKSLGDLFT